MAIHEPRAVLIMKLPQSLLDALDVHAYKLNLSRSAAVRQAIATWLDPDTTYKDTHGNTVYTPQEATQRRKESVRRAVKIYREKHKVNA